MQSVHLLTGVCDPHPFDFHLPNGGMGTEEIHIQEQTPVVGDFVVWYERVCTSNTPYTSETSVTCLGGQRRSWHAGITHFWQGEGQTSLCIPTRCGWTVATSFH